MYASGNNKKVLIILILEVLRKYSDAEHPLTQQAILKKLKEYGMDCDRRSVKSNVQYLKDMGYDISMDDGYRLISREFDDAELRILIDSVLFSKSISRKQAKEIVEKLRSLGSNYFSAKVSHISNLPEINRTENKQALYSVDTINDAIAVKKKIRFFYNTIGTDFKLRHTKDEPSVVSPYQIVANNGRFYLICNYDNHDNVVNIRIDKMTDVEMLEDKIKPMKDVPELANGLNLPKHMAEHMYMFSGPSVPVIFATTENMMSDLVDWFGKDIRVLKQGDNKITVRVVCNEKAMRFWALQYGPYVEILEPETLRSQIKADVEEMRKKYK